MRKISLFILAICPSLLAAWLLIKPKPTAATVGGDIFTGPESGDTGLIRRYLFEEEARALNLSDAIVDRFLNLVKRSAMDEPDYVSVERSLVDDNGRVERALNVIQLPRIYVFKAGKLTAFQRVGESREAFLERVRL
jgi:hypothetical protein